MRLAVGLLALALGTSPVWAEDAKPPTPEAPKPAIKVALRVVRVMPESKQALLFDKNRGTHVLVEVDGVIEGYRVTEIDDDSVTLSGEASSIVLAAPHRRDRKPEATATAPATPADPYADPKEAKPADPYAEGKAPEDPYDKPVRVVEAPKPVEPGSDGVRVVEAPKPDVKPADTKPADPKPADKPADKPATTTVGGGPAPAPTTTTDMKTPLPTSTNGVLTMTRAAFQQELGDFGKLAGGIKAGFVDKGARLDAVTEGSLFARAGLKVGDIVVTVGDRPLRSIDDAADLYARSSSARNITIQVLRAGKPVTLRVTIQ